MDVSIVKQYVQNCNVFTHTNAVMELQTQTVLNTCPHDFVSDSRHSTLLSVSIHQITYNFIYAVRVTDNKPQQMNLLGTMFPEVVSPLDPEKLLLLLTQYMVSCGNGRTTFHTSHL